ncbi:choice-of-anchor I family protein [Ideonella livida]|uniref:Alkaline phosphatase n=1 Tax=Ideonella livida TaxID=2707176 RepID=A0A7C9PHN3_9BURK|nr:choice-of-anchor I family protein [Ideonella livida]NDY92237.1 alkaline phosphatase [Ideonella livida]
MRRSLLSLCLAALAGAASAAPTTSIELSFLGRHSTGHYDLGGAEIPTYDPATRRLFVVNLADRAIDVLDISQPTAPVKVGALDISLLGQAANSVSAKNGVVAVAVEATVKTQPGLVAFYDAATLALLSTVPVGALPDMLTWTPDGQKVVVANEGEPSDDYTVDPEGSISIIDARDPRHPIVRTAGFGAWNSAKARSKLLAAGVRLNGPGATTAQDLEPEYITVRSDSRVAWVTLQENNAVARVNLDTAAVTQIVALGAKDHMAMGEGLDPSDKDNTVAIANWPVFGLYQPDAIANYSVGGQRYLVTANEGDSREYGAHNETSRVKSLNLDPVAFPNASALKTDAQLGRLTVTTAQGDTDGDGDFDRLYAFGARSFSVWTTDGRRVFDSGDQIERLVAAQYPANFNAGHTTNTRDDRSDNKGPEPEGLVLAHLWGKPYLFLGLERIGGVMVWDMSVPSAPQFVQYMNTRDFSATPGTAAAGDLGPEGLIVIPGQDSPTGRPLLVVANEVSGTTAIFQISPR